MPRGVPNAKRDEVPMRFTLFNIPPQMNQKQGGSHYLKAEDQTLWGRSKKLAKNSTGESTPLEGRRGSNVVVIHPGTRFLRIGRASDVFPITVPHVIARKSNVPVPPPIYIPTVTGKKQGKEKVNEEVMVEDSGMEVDDEARESWDPIDPKTSPIASSLRERMVFYKLHIVPKATEVCTSYNEQVQPTVIPDHNDPYRVEWIEGDSIEDILVGEKALCLADPGKLGYTIRWPFHGSRFNSFDYAREGPQALVNDVEALWKSVLRDMLKIEPETYKDFSVVLLVPDLFERSYVRELVNILLVQMGFKQVCVQQESISATYGAGISNACVIDAGAAKTSIAIVDEGLVLSDTRISLNMGGDDITGFLLALLERIHFPYRDADLSRSYDWNLIESLKSKICTLLEVDVAMNLYDFVVRRPGKQAEKYGFRTYNEVILAPMCIFEPRVIEFERKLVYTRPLWNPEVGEEIVEQANDQITQAMIISTQHLLPPPPSATASFPPPVPTFTPSYPVMDSVLEEGYGRPVFSVAPQTAQANDAGPPQVGTFADNTSATRSNAVESQPLEGTATDEERGIDQSEPTTPAPQSVYPQPGTYPGGFGIDVAFEAGKLPLDVAIFNSARAAGGDEKIRKYLQAVLVVGGTALVPGMAHALESRLQAIATPLVPNMEKVQIIPPPRDVDPRVLCWKGGAVLGKMDAVADLWVSRADWDVLGMRALKERSFFL
ncbi:actin-like ATPase domain-containing protein [Ramaria rubella]|nr:actin-like ATPase domain-containing protein [Ramaria rubella]